MSGALHSFSKAILHVDGDCFFASCEVARRPELKGKPVVTGLERGIVSSLTYEAKALGIRRPMPLWQVRKICPKAICLPSDYETYSLYSLRMFEIVRRFTPTVEEYSIDECFADLTGLRRPLRMSYFQMAQAIKTALDKELGFTFSVGLAPTKVLAKVGSKWKKPSGLTVISGSDIRPYLERLPVDRVWGIGPQTAAYLHKREIETAWQFSLKDEAWIRDNLTKPQLEIWQELRGETAYPVDAGKRNPYQSISKTKTFTPPSSDKEYIFSQISKNTENACIKLRRHRLAARKLFFFLKSQDFRYHGLEVVLKHPTDNPVEMIRTIERHYDSVYLPGKLFRATGVILTEVSGEISRQADLFGEWAEADKISRIFASADSIAKRYGKHSLFLGSSFQAMNRPQHSGGRREKSEREDNLFQGETKRRRLGIPFLGEAM